MNNKNILLGIGGVIITFVLLFFAYKLTNTPVKTEFPEVNRIRSTDHVKWKKDSKNILIEYSDLQCPACKSYNSFLLELEKEATPNAALVFRHYPLYQIHPNAFNAAYAAEAASLQGKFWEMESILYEKQSDWASLQNPNEFFVSVAKDLELDEEQFSKDMSSKEVKERVQIDLVEAEKIGINSTPTFVLNGVLVNVATFEEFKEFLMSL